MKAWISATFGENSSILAIGLACVGAGFLAGMFQLGELAAPLIIIGMLMSVVGFFRRD